VHLEAGGTVDNVSKSE